VVGAAAVVGKDGGGAGFEVAVREDGEADAAVVHGGVEDVDAAVHGSGIVGVGEVVGVSAHDGVDEVGMHAEAAIGETTDECFAAVLAPDVALEDVVVVGDDDRGAVAHEVAEGPAEEPEFAEVVENGLVDGLANEAVAGHPFVDLVAGEEEEIGVLGGDVAHERVVGEEVVLVAGEAGDDEFLVDGILADGAGPFGGGAGVFVEDAVGDVFFVVPLRHSKGGGAGERVDRFFGEFFPVFALLDFEADGVGVFVAEGRHHGRHFHGAA
jgi:hypothetical protein